MENEHDLSTEYVRMVSDPGPATPESDAPMDEWIAWTEAVLEERRTALAYWTKVEKTADLRQLPVWVRGAVVAAVDKYERDVEEWEERVRARRERAERIEQVAAELAGRDDQ